jgi:hypothetical protein
MCNDRGAATTRKRNGPNWDMRTTIEAALAGGLLEAKARTLKVSRSDRKGL